MDWVALGTTADGLVDLWRPALIAGAESASEQSGSVRLSGYSLYTDHGHEHALQVLDVFAQRLQMRAMRALMDDEPGLSLLLLERGRLIDHDVARRFLQLRLQSGPGATGDVAARHRELTATAEYLRSAHLMTVESVLALSRVQAALDVVDDARIVLAGVSREASDEDVIRELLSLPANATPLLWELTT